MDYERRTNAHTNENTAKKTYPFVESQNNLLSKLILVTGGAGFVGSHLVDKLMRQGHEVTVVDNYFTGRKSNIDHWCVCVCVKVWRWGCMCVR